MSDVVFESETVEAARQAADTGDWQTYMEVMGGAGCEQRARPIKLATQWSDKEGADGEPLGEIVFGVRCGDVEVQTWLHVWFLVHVPSQPTELTADLGGSALSEGLINLESCQ